MTNTNDPFDKQQDPADPGNPPSDPFADKLKEIKNEDGEQKYKDLNTALEALNSSQQFIPQLQSENAQLKTELEEVKTKLAEMGSIEDFVNKLKPQEPTPNTPPETPKQPQGVSAEDLAKLLDQRLNQRDQSQREQENYNHVVGELTKTYGDKAGEVIRQRATELNTTPDQLRNLAKENPTMALSLLGGVDVKAPPSTPSTELPPNGKPEPGKMTIEKGKGIARGGYTGKQLTELFRQSAEITNKRLGVES